MEYVITFWQTLVGTANWVWSSITFLVPWTQNYFYGLIVLSLLVYFLELTFPWRKQQPAIRADFWLDAFYMFFNFFIFSIIISGFYEVIAKAAAAIGLGMKSFVVIDISTFPVWIQLLLFFVILDFLQWITHILLHRFDSLWAFHKVHHSVREMGFAAHLRYHWMENVLYKPLKTFGVMILGGFEPEQAYFVHFIAITIGHLNHANLKITWGPFKYIFNNPVMHLWHHAKHLPIRRQKGVNFGISLSIWDYIFRTHYIPEQRGDIALGFDNIDQFPTDFKGQSSYGFFGRSKKL